MLTKASRILKGQMGCIEANQERIGDVIGLVEKQQELVADLAEGYSELAKLVLAMEDNRPKQVGV